MGFADIAHIGCRTCQAVNQAAIQVNATIVDAPGSTQNLLVAAAVIRILIEQL